MRDIQASIGGGQKEAIGENQNIAEQEIARQGLPSNVATRRLLRGRTKSALRNAGRPSLEGKSNLFLRMREKHAMGLRALCLRVCPAAAIPLRSGTLVGLLNGEAPFIWTMP